MVIAGKEHKNGLIYQEFTDPCPACTADEIDFVALNQAVAQSIIHYWPKQGQNDPDIQYSIMENWLIWLAARIEILLELQHRFARLERINTADIFSKGVGFCSQQAIAIANILRQKGISARPTELNGHVITVAQSPAGPVILDPDYNVVFFAALHEIEQNPESIASAYRNAGWNEATVQNIVRIYGPEGNTFYYATLILLVINCIKWTVPGFLLFIGMLMLAVRRYWCPDH